MKRIPPPAGPGIGPGIGLRIGVEIPTPSLLPPGATNRRFPDVTLSGTRLDDLPAGWSRRRIVGAHSLKLETAGPAGIAARFELRSGDWVSDGHRAELRDLYHAVPGSEVWYAFATMVPAEHPSGEDNICVLSQWHDQSRPGLACGKPPLAHRLRGRRFYVTLNADGHGQCTVAAVDPLPFGVWLHFVYHIRWSPGADGFVRGWLDGAPFLYHAGPVGYAADLGPYFKMGVYCARDVITPHVAWHAAYRRGFSPAVVR